MHRFGELLTSEEGNLETDKEYVDWKASVDEMFNGLCVNNMELVKKKLQSPKITRNEVMKIFIKNAKKISQRNILQNSQTLQAIETLKFQKEEEKNKIVDEIQRVLNDRLRNVPLGREGSRRGSKMGSFLNSQDGSEDSKGSRRSIRQSSTRKSMMRSSPNKDPDMWPIQEVDQENQETIKARRERINKRMSKIKSIQKEQSEAQVIEPLKESHSPESRRPQKVKSELTPNPKILTQTPEPAKLKMTEEKPKSPSQVKAESEINVKNVQIERTPKPKSPINAPSERKESERASKTPVPTSPMVLEEKKQITENIQSSQMPSKLQGTPKAEKEEEESLKAVGKK